MKQKWILFVGHSFIFWAAHYMERIAWRCNFHLGASACTEQRGQRGMLWGEFMGVVSSAAACLLPDMLVVYLGGNDLVKHSGKPLKS